MVFFSTLLLLLFSRIRFFSSEGSTCGNSSFTGLGWLLLRNLGTRWFVFSFDVACESVFDFEEYLSFSITTVSSSSISSIITQSSICGGFGED